MSKKDLEGILGVLLCLGLMLVACGGISFGFYLASYPETFVHVLGIATVGISAVAGASVFYYFVTKFFKHER